MGMKRLTRKELRETVLSEMGLSYQKQSLNELGKEMEKHLRAIDNEVSTLSPTAGTKFDRAMNELYRISDYLKLHLKPHRSDR